MVNLETYEKWLDAVQASKALAKYGITVTPRTLGEWARTKKVPSELMNGRRRFRLTALLAHFEPSRAAQG